MRSKEKAFKSLNKSIVRRYEYTEADLSVFL